MITLQKCKELLEQQEGIDAVEVCKDKYLQARFANRMNLEEPHALIVHPIEERLVLKVLVPRITQVRSSHSDLFRALQNLNYDLLIGRVGTDSQDGEVRFEINHPCQDGEMLDPSLEVFARLIEVATETTHEVVLLATHIGMVEAGVQPGIARQFVEQFYKKGNDGDAAETL